MIYYQKTMVTINKPEDGDDFYWYWLNHGISSSEEDKCSNKEYIWSDKEMKNFEYQIDVDKFLEDVRQGNAKYFSIKKRLFSKKEYLVYNNNWDEYECWNIEDIKRIDAWFSYTKKDMTINEAMERLDVEEYAKMMKGLGLNE